MIVYNLAHVHHFPDPHDPEGKAVWHLRTLTGVQRVELLRTLQLSGATLRSEHSTRILSIGIAGWDAGTLTHEDGTEIEPQFVNGGLTVESVNSIPGLSVTPLINAIFDHNTLDPTEKKTLPSPTS